MSILVHLRLGESLLEFRQAFSLINRSIECTDTGFKNWQLS